MIDLTEKLYYDLLSSGYKLNEIDHMDLFYYLHISNLEIKKENRVVAIDLIPGL